MRGIHWHKVHYWHKVPVMRKMFPFDDIIMGYCSETHQFHPVSFIDNIHCSCPSFWNFVQNMTLSGKFETIGEMRNKLWANKTSIDLSLRWVPEGYLIMQQPFRYICAHTGKMRVVLYSISKNYPHFILWYCALIWSSIYQFYPHSLHDFFSCIGAICSSETILKAMGKSTIRIQ